MKYYEITPESPAYVPAVKYYNAPAVWEKAHAEIKELLGGCELIDNLLYHADCLWLKNHVPDSLKSQFRKYTGQYYPAREKSEVNKKFLQIVEKYGLYTQRASDITYSLDLNGKGGQLYPPMDGRYYLATKHNVGKGVVEIPEPEFLRLRADWLESQNNKETPTYD